MRSHAAVSIVSIGLAVLATCFAGHPRASSPAGTANQPGKSVLSVEPRAVWVWGSDVRTQGAEVVAERLRVRGMTDAILLVKGSGGTVAYPSALAPQAAAGVDTLGAFLTACHARGIKVHAWVNYHEDQAYSARTKRANAIWHVRTMPAPPSPSATENRVCPLAARDGYNQYFLGVVEEILDHYDVDGIHLDYIRYPHAVYCFCPRHQAEAAVRGIDFTRVRTLINKTFYPAPGDGKTFFNALAAGDPDAAGWVGMREEEINGVVETVKDLVDSENAMRAANGRPQVQLSAALQPEAALSESEHLGRSHYAQNYETLARHVSFIAPMAYHKDFNHAPAWVGDVTAGAVAKAAPTPVWAGIQTYSVTSQEVADALAAARRNGAAGFVLFRYAVSASGEAAAQAIVPSIESLRKATENAGDAGWLDGGTLNSLGQKLRNAEQSLDSGNARAAWNQLGAFINELEAQNGKHVDPRAARALAADAAWVRDLIQM